MADIFDRAQEINELFRENALNNQRAKAARLGIAPYKKHVGIVPRTIRKDCSDCGEPIPAKRLKANPQATRCVECQEKYERKGSD